MPLPWPNYLCRMMAFRSLSPSLIGLCFSLLLVALPACTEKPSAEGQAKPETAEPAPTPAAFTPDTSACRMDSVLYVDGGAGERLLRVESGMAIARINFNEQTDEGDVAKPGMTICLADFPLQANDPWARPPGGKGAKIELRMFTGDDSPLSPGVYQSARGGNRQLGPMLYLDGDTHPFAFPRIGRVFIHRVDGNRVCGELALETISGLSMRGSFDVPVVQEIR